MTGTLEQYLAEKDDEELAEMGADAIATICAFKRSQRRQTQAPGNAQQQLQPDNLPEDGDSDYWDDHATGK